MSERPRTKDEKVARRFFHRMEPLTRENSLIAWVETGKHEIAVFGGRLSVSDALRLRAWLNSVLPL